MDDELRDTTVFNTGGSETPEPTNRPAQRHGAERLDQDAVVKVRRESSKIRAALAARVIAAMESGS